MGLRHNFNLASEVHIGVFLFFVLRNSSDCSGFCVWLPRKHRIRALPLGPSFLSLGSQNQVQAEGRQLSGLAF